MKTLKIAAQLFRAAKIERDGEGEDMKLRMSISSDEPYLRTDLDGEKYFEQLGHEPGDISDGRLKAGLPILFNHNRDDHLGRASSYSVKADETGKKRCEVGDINRSQSDFAQEKWKDAENGSLPDTSVGYRVLDDGECVGVKDGIPVYKFKWEPHEGSIVTVPADYSVGVGRDGMECLEVRIFEKSVDPNKNRRDKSEPAIVLMAETSTTTETPPVAPVIDVVAEQQKGRQEVLANQKKIWSFVQGLKTRSIQDAAKIKAMEYITEGKSDVGEFTAMVIAGIDGVRDTTATSPNIGIPDSELKRFSFTELLRTQGRDREGIKVPGHYMEASREVTKLMDGKEPQGIWIPQDMLGRSLASIHGLGGRRLRNLGRDVEIQSRALTATNFSAGGALIGTDLLEGSLIDLLLNRIAFLENVTYLGGLVGNIAIPRITGPVANSFWLPEGGSVTSNDMSFSQLTLTPKRLASLMVYDKQLVAQSSLSVEALVRDYLARIMAVEKNRAMINGSGVNGQPLGLLNTPGIQTRTFSVAGAPTWGEIVGFDTLVEQANADTLGQRSWLTAPGAKGNLKVTGRALTGANVVVAVPIWMDDDTMNGYPGDVTQNVPNNQVLFGSGGDFVVGDWAGVDMVVDPYSMADKAQIRLVINMWTDQGVRHEVAFVISTNNAA